MSRNVYLRRWAFGYRREVATHHPSVCGEPRIYQHVQKIRGYTCTTWRMRGAYGVVAGRFHVVPRCSLFLWPVPLFQGINLTTTTCFCRATRVSSRCGGVYVAPTPLLGYPRRCGNAVNGVYTHYGGLISYLPPLRQRQVSLLYRNNHHTTTSTCGFSPSLGISTNSKYLAATTTASHPCQRLRQ